MRAVKTNAAVWIIFAVVFVSLNGLDGTKCRDTTFALLDDDVVQHSSLPSKSYEDVEELYKTREAPMFLRVFAGMTSHFPGRTWAIMLRPRTSDLEVIRQHICECLSCIERALGPEVLSNVTNIIDLGGNTGMSVLAWTAQYPRARVVVVEPGPDTFMSLRLNTAHLLNVYAEYGAIWSEPGLVNLHGTVTDLRGDTSGNWATTVSKATGLFNTKLLKDLVPSLTIPFLKRKYHMPIIDILKVDVESAEVAVFNSDNDLSWLLRVRVVAIEVHTPQIGEAWLVYFKQLMQRHGFQEHPDHGELKLFSRNVPAQPELG